MRNQIVLGLVLLLLANLYFWPKENKKKQELITYPNQFSVTLFGEIVFPGTYYFYEETTLNEVIFFAGGVKKDADLSKINLSEKITSNKVINVTKINEIDINDQIVKIDLNKATFSELILIPNITENRALSILLYREQNGLFLNVEELLLVKYIGEATFEKISPYFKV